MLCLFECVVNVEIRTNGYAVSEKLSCRRLCVTENVVIAVRVIVQ